jgi:hypothetical protein
MKLHTWVVAAGSLFALTIPAFAGPIIQPAGASTSLGQFNASYPPSRVIDQSGLAATYTSGVTNFDTFVPATKTVNGANVPNIWFSANNVITGNFDFDLGSPIGIESFALWTDPQPGAHQGPRNFALIGALDPAFTVPIALGTYNALEGTGDANNFGQVFTFTPTVARYVRMQINTNWGSPATTGMVEAAFEASVPEPATPTLLLTAAAATLFRRNRPRK